jgi:signal transduction histidine kinase
LVTPAYEAGPETPAGQARAAHGPDRASAELAAVLGAVDAGIVTVGPGGRVRSQNDIATGILGGHIDGLADALGPFSRSSCLEDGGSPGEWRHERTELQLVARPDRWLEVVRHVDPDGDFEAIVLRDVTVARQSRGLRDAFLGMLSHELRTPVTSIYAASDLLRSTSTSLDATERTGLVEDIAWEAERLLRLVDDLLVLARYEEGVDLLKEPSLLQRVVPAVVDRERRRWPGIDIDLRVGPELPVVSGDETSVQQVVRNLVSNAAKYGAGSPVLVELQASGEERGAIVRVLDRGHGLEADEGEAIFRPFVRTPRAAAMASGAGVGLYVCRRLVEAMGGHMWARPRKGGGSEFGFWLPEYAADVEIDDGPVPVEHDANGIVPPVDGGGRASSREGLASPGYRDGTRIASGRP